MMNNADLVTAVTIATANKDREALRQIVVTTDSNGQKWLEATDTYRAMRTPVNIGTAAPTVGVSVKHLPKSRSAKLRDLRPSELEAFFSDAEVLNGGWPNVRRLFRHANDEERATVHPARFGVLVDLAKITKLKTLARVEIVDATDTPNRKVLTITPIVFLDGTRCEGDATELATLENPNNATEGLVGHYNAEYLTSVWPTTTVGGRIRGLPTTIGIYAGERPRWTNSLRIGNALIMSVRV